MTPMVPMGYAAPRHVAVRVPAELVAKAPMEYVY